MIPYSNKEQNTFRLFQLLLHDRAAIIVLLTET